MKRVLITTLALIAIILGALAIVGLVSEPVTPDIPDAYQGQHLKVSGIDLRVQQLGKGQDVMLIHGLPGSIESWETVTPILAERYRVTVYDRPGHGFSEYQQDLANLEGNLRIASALIDTLDLKNVIVVGHSYGGSMVTAMAARPEENIKGYVSIAGLVEPGRRSSPVYDFVTIPAIGTGFARIGNQTIGHYMMKQGLIRAFDPNPLPENFMERRDDFWLLLKSTLATAHEVSDMRADVAALSYQELAMPFYLLHGRQDASVPVENALAVKESNPEARLNIFDNTGHMLQFIHPEAVVAAVDRVAAQLADPDLPTP